MSKPDYISSEKATEIYDNQLKHAATREYFKSIVEDYIGSVEFMKKVREYASMEIDARLFTSTKFWLTTVVAALISAGIGAAITHYFGK